MTPERVKELRALADKHRMSTEFAGGVKMPIAIGLDEALDEIEKLTDAWDKTMVTSTVVMKEQTAEIQRLRKGFADAVDLARQLHTDYGEFRKSVDATVVALQAADAKLEVVRTLVRDQIAAVFEVEKAGEKFPRYANGDPIVLIEVNRVLEVLK